MSGVSYLFGKYYLNRQGWIDGTAQFRKLIESNLKQDSVVLDIGAGASSQHNFRGRCKKIVGIDISADVMRNPSLDEARVCDAADLPFTDNTFDLAFADFVLEHLPEPGVAAGEIFRVLKPGAKLCIRTPNLLCYVYLISRMTPYAWHIYFRKILQGKPEEDTFRVYYRVNTRHGLKYIFEKAGFIVEKIEMVEKEPSYLMKWPFTFMFGLFYERLLNSVEFLSIFRANIFAVLRKP